LDQPDPPQDVGAHHDLANLGRADHQGAHMRRIEGQCAAAFRAGPPARQYLASRELAHLARKLTGVVGSNWRLSPNRISARDVDCAFEHEPGWSVALADIENDFARLKMSYRTTGEALGGLDLTRVKRREHLVVACFEDTHGDLLECWICPILPCLSVLRTTPRADCSAYRPSSLSEG
jgi:hypothetical protein